MTIPENTLKTALKAGQVQHGVWLAARSTIATEIAGNAGFDWCLLDCEHGPNTVTDLLPQIQALAATGTPVVVRVPNAEEWMIKQVLDMGVQTVLVPMVDDAKKADEMARAMRYAPSGNRGVGAILGRASGYGADADYVHGANEQMCLLVQVESAVAIENIDAIAAVEGVDGVFVGPADLSADMGHTGNSGHPDVVKAIEHAIARIVAAGKIAGIVGFDESQFAGYKKQGITFLGVGADTYTLMAGLRGLAQRVKAS